MLHTTFALAKQHSACREGYEAVAKALGGVKVYGKDTPIPLSEVATKGRGLVDALWCLRAVLPEEEARRDRFARLFACDCAEHVLPIWEATYPDDPSPRQVIEVSRRYALGLATIEEMAAARVAAWAAARVAAWAARVAARAAWAAAWDAAWDAEAAARESELQWQLTRFLEALELEGRE